MASETAEGGTRGYAPPPVSAGTAIASARVGDLGRALFRYRGAVLLAVGIFVASGLLPGPKRSETEEAIETGASRSVPAATIEDEPPVGAPILTDTDVVVDDQPARFSTIDPGDRFDEPRPETRETASPPAADLAPAAPSRDEDSRPVSTTMAPSPLRIRESAWSSRTAGTPLASEGVPEGSLPVGRRVGNDDKLSFVRLSGTATVLQLKLAAPEGHRSPEAAAVRACPITSDWEPGTAMSFDSDPEYECAKAVDGKAQADGTWSFDLAGFPDRASNRGFALVPSGDAALADWQVAFAARA